MHKAVGRSYRIGAIPIGTPGDKKNKKDQRVNWDENNPSFTEIYSTEHNIDAWALLNMLYLETNPYATKPDVPIGHEYNTPKSGNLSTVGAEYAILALLNYDPLNYDKTKKYIKRKVFPQFSVEFVNVRPSTF
ncbi:MAG: hypothetical protein AB1765_13360 [Candidatus Hydrogenedentota bacterium]